MGKVGLRPPPYGVPKTEEVPYSHLCPVPSWLHKVPDPTGPVPEMIINNVKNNVESGWAVPDPPRKSSGVELGPNAWSLSIISTYTLCKSVVASAQAAVMSVFSVSDSPTNWVWGIPLGSPSSFNLGKYGTHDKMVHTPPLSSTC